MKIRGRIFSYFQFIQDGGPIQNNPKSGQSVINTRAAEKVGKCIFSSMFKIYNYVHTKN